MNKKNMISVHHLKTINLEDGNVLHGLKKSDAGFVDFGEAYFSVVNCDAIKAWKLHQSMTLNLVVPVGKVLFVFFYPSEKIFKEVIIGDENYKRINVPPGIWFGFKGLNHPTSVIMNVADMEHNPEEVMRKSINEFKYSW